MDTDFRRCRELIELPHIFRLAKNVSKLSTHKHHMGAVIVSSGHPISVGCNQSKSHPAAPYNGLHAEVQAIKTSGKNRVGGSTVVVYREKRNGTVGMARPCEKCMEALRAFGVKKVYYTTDEYPFWTVEKI